MKRYAPGGGWRGPLLTLAPRRTQVKNLKRYFTFEVQILDDKGVRRRFRASNYQSATRVKPFICTMPMKLDDGWNQIQFNLAEFTKRAYGGSCHSISKRFCFNRSSIKRLYTSVQAFLTDFPPDNLSPAVCRLKLRGDAAGAIACQLPHPTCLLLRPAVLGGGATSRVQALPACPRGNVMNRALHRTSILPCRQLS